MEKLIIIAIYYCIINAVGALINIADKRLAIKGKRRISEKFALGYRNLRRRGRQLCGNESCSPQNKAQKFYGRYALFNYSACCGDCNNHLSNMH